MYRSKLEQYFADQASKLGLQFDYEKSKYVLQAGFKSSVTRDKNGVQLPSAIRAITYTPDFVSGDGKYIVEIKGHFRETFNIKFKLFLNLIEQQNRDVRVSILTSKKAVDEYLKSIT